MPDVHYQHNEKRRDIAIIGVASGIGAPDPGCADGPSVLAAMGVAKMLQSADRNAAWTTTVVPAEGDDKIAVVGDCATRTASAVSAAMAGGYFAVVIGGDHSCAIGTWRGVAQAMADKPIGLLWIDAHLDSHTPETSHSGALHGMPLACLLGVGPAALTHGMQTIKPHHIAVIGARSFEAEENSLLSRLGVRVFFMAEIAQRGLDAVMQEALSIVQRGTAGFGVSLDLDAVDPRDAPGVNSAAPSGLRATELVPVMARLRNHPGLLALEIAEYDPYRDEDGRTARVVSDMLCAVLGAGDQAPQSMITMEHLHGAHNYDPLPVVLAKGKGVYLWDEQGRRYMDMMSAYSAVSLGHAHPRILEVLTQQAGELAVTSRAYHNNRLPLLLQRLCKLTGLDQALPVNTGLEAVETAIKAARKWAYEIKGVAADCAEIIACEGNFHGRSTTIIAMSTEPQYRKGFGPFTPGFRHIPYGDSAALANAITPNTAAFLVEPVQGEAGIIVPPRGYLVECARICRERNVLLICDEIQTGLGRTGKFLACEHDEVLPDGVILGKALGGGVLPVSAFVARHEVMQVFRPGDHGSTFGGNPLAAAVALEALRIIVEEKLAERSARLGGYLLSELRCIRSPLIREVRGLGLFVGVDINPAHASARQVCGRLMVRGILSKDTHGTVIRFAPPLVVTREQINEALCQIRHVFNDCNNELRWVA
jgi:ornithine--oxo-acid transaminase